jgi:glycerol-3-phosphate acyltransferase PlsY
MSTYLIVAAIAYLLGSIPFGYILVRLFRGQDIRQTGSGNIGATNVARSGAKGLGLLTLLLDAGKGFAAVMIATEFVSASAQRALEVAARPGLPAQLAQAIQPHAQEAYLLPALAALLAILGHVFPVWLRFKGGKGVATGVGSFIALAPKAVGIVLVIFLVVVAVFRHVSLGSIVATAAFPLFAWLLYRYAATPAVMATIVAAALLIILKHKDNIRRLLAGTEHRFELRKG